MGTFSQEDHELCTNDVVTDRAHIRACAW